jgi:hypothetical protein
VRRQRGQSLPLAIAGLFCGVLLFAFSLRAYRQIVERERLRARADVSAFSGGISYARGLNILAASQKAVGLGWALFVFDGGSTKDAVQTAQRVLLEFGPWLSLGVMENVALENGVAGLPVWNKPTVFDDLTKEDLLPSYNVEPYTVKDAVVEAWKKGTKPLDDLGEGGRALRQGMESATDQALPDLEKGAGSALQKALPGLDPDGLYQQRYEYTRRDGTVVQVPASEAHAVWENGPHGTKVLRHKSDAKHGYRYVRSVPVFNPGFQLSLRDGDPHMIAFFAVPAADPLGGRLALTQIQVAGGSQSLVDPDGSAYNATVVPLSLFPEQGWSFKNGAIAALGESVALDQGLSTAQGALEALPLPAALAQRGQGLLDLTRELSLVQH